MNFHDTRKSRDALISGLTEDLTPVRSMRFLDGAAAIGVATLLTVAGVFLVKGFWSGIAAGEVSPFFWVTHGLLLLLGMAAASSAITMASPKVGNNYDAPRWMSAMLAVLPITAIIAVLSDTEGAHGHAHGMTGAIAWSCIGNSLVASGLVAVSIVMWLRRGAPVSTGMAGWMTGLAAGSIGTVTYGLSCSLDSVGHLGVAHVVPVAITAVIGRMTVPSMIRW